MCGGHCCDSETELLLKEQGRKDFATLLRHNSRSLLGPINRTAAVLQSKYFLHHKKWTMPSETDGIIIEVHNYQ